MRKLMRNLLTSLVGAGLAVAVTAGPALANGSSWSG